MSMRNETAYLQIQCDNQKDIVPVNFTIITIVDCEGERTTEGTTKPPTS